jgi:hypothetical protein
VKQPSNELRLMLLTSVFLLVAMGLIERSGLR